MVRLPCEHAEYQHLTLTLSGLPLTIVGGRAGPLNLSLGIAALTFPAIVISSPSDEMVSFAWVITAFVP